MLDRIVFRGATTLQWYSEQLPLFPRCEVQQIDTANIKFVKAHFPRRYLTGELSEDCYARTLISDTTAADDPATLEWCREGYAAWQTWMQAGARGKVPQYHDALINSGAFWRTDFCVTAHGYMCLVHAMTKVGDYVAILDGHTMPVSLRRAASEFEAFELIGDCYIHGMMQGQAWNLIDEHKCKFKAVGNAEPENIMLPKKVEESLQIDNDEDTKDPVEDYSTILPTLGKRIITLV